VAGSIEHAGQIKGKKSLKEVCPRLSRVNRLGIRVTKPVGANRWRRNMHLLVAYYVYLISTRPTDASLIQGIGA
jgi:hypothetical protein